MNTNNYILLSYYLSSNLSAYGNGKRISIKKLRSISTGDSSNNSALQFSSHLGTHIDFPYHFCNDGQKSNDYNISDFIFNCIGVIYLNDFKKGNQYLILKESIVNQVERLDENIDFLIIKTGFCEIRNEEKYWSSNPGLHPELASYLRGKFNLLRAIGFDSISLSSYKHREIGRVAHREFLCKNKYLIIEDMNLSQITPRTIIKKVTIAPLLVEGIDGTPVTVIAEVTN